jgi:hypothetical protein
MYSYSDSTSPAPITDGKTVWFTNNSGEIGAFDMNGKPLWSHKWTPWGEPYPFNKQHKPILYGDWILNVEPLDGNPADKKGWNYLRALDKNFVDPGKGSAYPRPASKKFQPAKQLKSP